MEASTQIEAVLQQIRGIQRSSVQVTQRFKSHGTQIGLRAARIRRDVRDWENAIANIHATQEAVEIAEQAYHFPPCVDDVLSRGRRDPPLVCASLAHVVKATAFLNTHPPTDAGERLRKVLGAKMARLVVVAEGVVVAAAATAIDAALSVLQQQQAAAAAAAATDGPTATLLQQRSLLSARVLADVDAAGTVAHTLRRCFPRRATPVPGRVRDLLAAAVQRDMQRRLDRSYADDYTSLHAVARIHRRGAHPLAGVAANGRRALAAALTIAERLVVRPMSGGAAAVAAAAAERKRAHRSDEGANDDDEDDYDDDDDDDDDGDGRDPGDVDDDVAASGAALFRLVTKTMLDLFKTASAGPAEALKRRLAAATAAAGSEARRKRAAVQARLACAHLTSELLYASFDFLVELWAWRDVAATTPGEAAVAIEHANDAVEDYCETVVCEFVFDYLRARGSVTQDLLTHCDSLYPNCSFSDAAIDLSSALGQSWQPPSDCSTHETTNALMHVLSVVCTEYFGALKIALADGDERQLLLDAGAGAGGGASPDGVAEMSAHVAEAAASATERAVGFVDKCIAQHKEDLATMAECARRAQLRSDDAFRTLPVSNAPLFLLNNYNTVLQTLRRDAGFASERRRGAFADIVADLERNIETCVQSCAEYWSALFPPLDDGDANYDGDESGANVEVLMSIARSEGPLTRDQRDAVKAWHSEAIANVVREVRNASYHTLANRSLRMRLVEDATKAIRGGFAEMEELLDGRKWTTHPGRYWKPTLTEILADVSKLF